MTTQTPQSFSTSGPGDPASTGSESGTTVRERAGHVGGTAKDEAAGVAQEVKYQARDLVGEARGQVRQQVDVQRGRVSDLLRDLSEELEQMADRSERNGLASDLARQAAMRARDVRSYLDGGGDVVEDIRRFARRRPGTFLLGAVAAGVVAGRATRAAAAARRQQQQSDERGGYGYPAGHPGTYPTAGTPGYGAAAATSAGTTVDEAGTTTYEPTTGYVAAGPTGSQPGYVAPSEPLPADREER
jgi:uncharacterized protein YjbJ (UPF0337 family)